jgi:hypothetical protein
MTSGIEAMTIEESVGIITFENEIILLRNNKNGIGIKTDVACLPGKYVKNTM